MLESIVADVPIIFWRSSAKFLDGRKGLENRGRIEDGSFTRDATIRALELVLSSEKGRS